MTDVLVSPPAEEPVSLEEAKAHLRVEHMQEDTHIRSLVLAARQHIEQYTSRALVTQTWERVLDAFPSGEIDLARGKLQSVASIKYRDVEGVEQTLDAAAFIVDTDREPGRVALAPSASWPTTQTRINAVRVRFVAGYGAAAAVPQPIKAAMLLIIGHLYEHREMEILGTITTPLKFAVDSLLSPYRLGRVG